MATTISRRKGVNGTFNEGEVRGQMYVYQVKNICDKIWRHLKKIRLWEFFEVKNSIIDGMYEKKNNKVVGIF